MGDSKLLLDVAAMSSVPPKSVSYPNTPTTPKWESQRDVFAIFADYLVRKEKAVQASDREAEAANESEQFSP